MQNVEFKLDGTKLTITIDTAKRLGLSASKKSELVASTHGNVTVGGVTVGVNAYVKANVPVA